MRTGIPLTVSVCLLLLVSGAEAADPNWRTSPPVTYVLDYGQGHIGNPEYIETVAKSPPTILHLGKDTVMSHNWGPIQGVGGENQAGGRGEAVRRLSPEETWDRYHALEAMVDGLHEAGVEYVMPYICSVTIGGHHEHRRGFWEFYDHWDEYRDFGLPPRPELDPAEWMQRLPDGSMKPTYGCKPDEDEFYPPYKPNLRYAACVNNPGWRTWIDSVVRLVAEVGYDGAFIDNGSNQRCYCRFCQEKYQDFLSGRYTDAQIRELFGAEPGQVPLAVRPDRDEEPTLAWVESQRFWRESVYEHQQAMRRAGEEVNDRFILFPNGGHNRSETVKQSFRDTNYVMYELSLGDYGTHPGLVRSRIVEDIYMNVRNHHIWQLKYTQATREGVSALLLTRAGYPTTKAAFALNPLAAALGNAEAAAFGSGAGFLLRPRWNEYADVLNRYRAFFEENAEAYTGLVPHAQVGVAAFGEQNFYEHSDHIAMVERLCEELSAEHVLFDLVTEELFTADHLAQFGTVIFPDVKYASPEQLEALSDYVEGGGQAVVIGGAPTHDMLLRPLSAADVPSAMRPEQVGEDRGAMREAGSGWWSRYERLPLEGLLEAIGGPEAGLSTAPEAGPGVRVNAFVDPDGSRMTLHVLNYDTPLGTDPEGVPDNEHLALSVSLPDGAEVAGVRALSPDAGSQEVAWTVEEGRLEMTLPRLHIYALLQVEMT